MKKLVPPTRSSSRSRPPASRTGKASSARMAVVNHAHTVSGIRSSDMPRARRLRVVVRKFRAVSSEATQKIAMLITHSVCPVPNPGPATCPSGAQRGVGRPTRDRGAAGGKQRGHHDGEGNERDPEREHVEHGEGHVARAHLDGQKVVAEARQRRGGQHEEDHDGAVHGHHRQIELRSHRTSGEAEGEQSLQQRPMLLRPGQP